LSALAATLRDRERVRGEIVLMVGGTAEAPVAVTEAPAALVARLQAEGRTRREAVKEAAARLGLGAREVYRLSLGSSSE
jgi:16S rRNA (cytidine1402-2'-O)-methyltransferase